MLIHGKVWNKIKVHFVTVLGMTCVSDDIIDDVIKFPKFILAGLKMVKTCILRSSLFLLRYFSAYIEYEIFLKKNYAAI